jgi:hypothetical protein
VDDEYAARFTDSRGTEETSIFNDGETLRMELRGVTLEDTCFDSFEPVTGSEPSALLQLPLHNNELCSCRLAWTMPVTVCDEGDDVRGTLACEMELGPPDDRGGLASESLKLELSYAGHRHASVGASGWFEDELLHIQGQLPDDTYLKVCINCLYSDYSPYGHGFFGNMMCFRNMKAEYLEVRSKNDFLEVQGRHERCVQETYLCDEFERRVPGTGYRG